MKKLLFVFFSIHLMLFPSLRAEAPSSKIQTEEESVVFFTPPAGWLLADPNSLPKHVRVMVIGKSSSVLPPRLNLSWEPYKGTLKQYLKTVKNMNAAEGYEWKDLGNIQTQAGTGNLSQVDIKSQWGELRLMHVILIKNGNVYILTASALKDEFAIFYKEFFAAMRSLKVAKDIYETLPDPQQRHQLKTAANTLLQEWGMLLQQKQKEAPQINTQDLQESIFKSEEFQNTLWSPFKEMLKHKYSQLGAEWHALFLQNLEDQLFKNV